jgi:DNA-binding response OmpR family regulator
VRDASRALRVGPLEIFPGQGLVLADGRVVPMSVREFELLIALAESDGAIVRRTDLFGRVWGRELRSGDRSIDVYVHKLRSKLEAALPGHRFIHTHVGFGYRLSHERDGAVHPAAGVRDAPTHRAGST